MSDHYLDATDLEPDELCECDGCGAMSDDTAVVLGKRMDPHTGYRDDDAVLCRECRKKKGIR